MSWLILCQVDIAPHTPLLRFVGMIERKGDMKNNPGLFSYANFATNWRNHR
jgi:hypothetical protein